MDNLRTLFRYNARVLLANSYWLLIIPVVASQLVIFWHMAIASLVTPATVARTCELVIPLLGAFLAAHALAPEQRYRVDEITFARPVPFTRTIILRLLALYSLLVILAVLMMYVYRAGLKIDVELGDVLLAGVPSVLFLSMLSLAFAAAWRSPALGIGAALLYWIADAWKGSALNPLMSLYGYATWLQHEKPEDERLEWVASKAILTVLALVLIFVVTRGLQRPASPRRWQSILRLAVGVLVVAAAYFTSGAVWQYQKAARVAASDPQGAREAYRATFAQYGPIPAAYLFGQAFAQYVGYQPGASREAREIGESRTLTITRMRSVAERWPDGPWADNALYEVIRISPTGEDNSEESRTANRVLLETSRDFLNRYPTSEFAPWVAARMVTAARLLGDEKSMQWAYERSVKVYGGSAASARAAAEMRQFYVDQGQLDKAVESARLAAEAAAPEDRPEALLDLASFLAQQGKREEAREILQRVEKAVQEKLAALGLEVLTLENATPENMKRRSEILQLRTRAREELAALDGQRAAP